MTELLAFLGVAIVVIVTPGQDTALTVRTTLAGGRSAGVRTAAGVVAQSLLAAARRRTRGDPARGATPGRELRQGLLSHLGNPKMAGDVLRRPRVRRTLDAVTGTALVALGIRLAATER